MIDMAHLRGVIGNVERIIDQKQNCLCGYADIRVERFLQHRMPEQTKTHARYRFRATLDKKRFPFKAADEFKQRFIAAQNDDAAFVEKREHIARRGTRADFLFAARGQKSRVHFADGTFGFRESQPRHRVEEVVPIFARRDFTGFGDAGFVMLRRYSVRICDESNLFAAKVFDARATFIESVDAGPTRIVGQQPKRRA